MKQIQRRDVKKGEFFTKKPLENPAENQVFVAGRYDRSSKKYEHCKFSDVCSYGAIQGNVLVYVDFVF